ncbi:vasoactive intestinal polypeptide receptor-like [Sinocyclocheilus grahami]|uniref:vasoactive intestinal polypeptide receptor-like n=1 Tax=Sinocyclocheilus grahami TaxID=75366 RepID=UPI0007AC5F18|nr:PREDICTED: vasoactive intestinal polypeptide receptor-like [Sinocyclocheilus grahami]
MARRSQRDGLGSGSYAPRYRASGTSVTPTVPAVGQRGGLQGSNSGGSWADRRGNLLLLLSALIWLRNERSRFAPEVSRCSDKSAEAQDFIIQLSCCKGMWDIIACWPSAKVGEHVVIPCPNYFRYFSDLHEGNLSKTCTADGWTEMDPMEIAVHCGYNLNGTVDDDSFFRSVKIGYTIGHSVSLISLTTAIVILCISRKLHCTRNYIHMHLFVSFILKAIAVFVKDAVLYDVFQESDNCSTDSVGCKAVIVFFQYCIMASFFWLLVEGLYLHALLAVSFFSERKYFWWYILIGWGGPTIFIMAWSFAKAYFNDVGCWDIIENSDLFWWIIKTPILASILMNFILFICIIRILRQKINCPDIGRNESNQYSRLAKSTLLLIPLFGINFIIFAFIPENIKTELRLVFDLILGSFQGFVVAVLYCFMNGEGFVVAVLYCFMNGEEEAPQRTESAWFRGENFSTYDEKNLFFSLRWTCSQITACEVPESDSNWVSAT